MQADTDFLEYQHLIPKPKPPSIVPLFKPLPYDFIMPNQCLQMNQNN